MHLNCLTRGLEISRKMGAIPLGFIEVRVDKDRYENDVSLINMSSGRVLRMVHHSLPNLKIQFATIYAGRGKFIKYESYFTEKDSDMHRCKLAGYEIGWIEGKNAGVRCPLNGPDISESLKGINADAEDTFIVHVISSIEYEAHLWMTKMINSK